MPKRIVVRSLAIAIIPIAMLIAACRSGQQPGESWIHDSGQHSTPVPAAKSGEIKDPIVAMLAAASVDKKGRVVNPKFTFDATEPQITVIVQVGKITDADLHVVWYQVTDSGDQKLFEHHVPVASYERAYSIGKNRGLFASGRYKVVATLAGQTKSIEFSVRQQTAPTKKSGMPASTENVRADLTGETPWPFAGGMYNVATFVVPLKTIAFAWMLEAPLATGASPASTEQGRPPVDGGSGKTAAPASPTPQSAAGCRLALQGHEGSPGPEPPEDWTADTADVNLWVDCADSTNVGVFGSVSGAEKQVAELFPTPGNPQSLMLAFDPCSVPGGSDLPGTKVGFRVAKINTDTSQTYIAQLTMRLGDDTSPPHLNVVSTPARGTKVKPGDKISLKIKAYEQRSDETWQTGVMAIQLTADPGGLVTSKDYLQYRGKSCAAKSWEQKLDATYTVPPEPPPIFQLCAIAEDFAGNKDSKCGEFRTGNTWNGKVHLVSSVDNQRGEGCVNETWDAEFHVVVRGSEVQGKGRAHLVGQPQCHLPFHEHCDNATQAQFDVRGKLDGKQFRLAFAETAIDGATCGLANHTFFLDPRHPGLSHRSPSDFTVPIIAAGDAEANVSNSEVWPGSVAKGQQIITMLCQDCK